MAEIIRTENLQYAYPADEGAEPVLALKGVDLTIEQGSFVVVLGHNGSGKSTLAKTLNGVLLPCGGHVYVEGMDTLDEHLLLAIRRTVGMVFQNPDNQIVANVVEEDVAFAPENLGVSSREIRQRVDDALAAVGSAFTLMTFLTSILLGLAMGSGTVFSIKFGQKDDTGLREGVLAAFVLLAIVTAVLTGAVYLGFEGIIWFLRLPAEIAPLMRTYLKIVFAGLAAIFLYNYFASLLRALGNSMVPLLFLALSAGLNIALDLWFVCRLGRGVGGAAEATVIAQYVSGVGISVYTWVRFPLVRQAAHSKFKANRMKEIAGFSALTCIQQSIMNLGILAVQGLVNSFGTVVMAAFAAAVKIDAFAYLPVQDFGNAFSIFIAQNYGAQKTDRIHKGIRGAFAAAIGFSIAVSALVFVFAALLMRIFIAGSETAVITEGVRYLRIEGAFYAGIGCLFLFYGLYRAVGRPGMSVVLTVVSLGTRVVLAYALSAIPAIGVTGIWWSVPIGWFLADAVGGVYYWMKKKALFEMK